jgi:hypothetical protein
LYGCESWSVTLRKEFILNVFENRALRRIFGPKRDEIMARWRKLHNEELPNLYSPPRRMRCVGYVGRMGEKGKACRILVGKPEGKIPPGRPRSK